MKKIKLLTLLAILTTTTVYGEGRNIIEGRVAGSFGGKFDTLEENGSQISGEDSDGGYEIILEATREFFPHAMPNTYLGVGVGFQDLGKAKNINGRSANLYNAIPLYLTGKYQFNTKNDIQPFISLNLGVSINRTGSGIRSIDDKVNDMGFYGAIGVGVEYHQFLVNLSYQLNTATTKEHEKQNINNQRVTLGLGYRFDY